MKGNENENNEQLIRSKELFENIRRECQEYSKSQSTNPLITLFNRVKQAVGTMGPEGFARRQRLLEAIDKANSVEEILTIIGTLGKNYNEKNEEGYFFLGTDLANELFDIVCVIRNIDEGDVKEKISAAYRKNFSTVASFVTPQGGYAFNFEEELKGCLYFFLTNLNPKTYSVFKLTNNSIGIKISPITKPELVKKFENFLRIQVKVTYLKNQKIADLEFQKGPGVKDIDGLEMEEVEEGSTKAGNSEDLRNISRTTNNMS